jgi:hypothetical protein
MPSWAPTVFDTDEWLDAWTRATIDRQTILDPGRPPRYVLEDSPFWRGYEADLEMGAVWDRPVLTIGSVYSVFGPAFMSGDEAAIGALVDSAKEQAADLDTAGVLVFNLPPEAARAWAAIRPPDSVVRLDTAYSKVPGAGSDPVMGTIKTNVRTEWRRRWRRATEKNIRLIDDDAPNSELLDRVVELTVGSAVKHGWPVLYDKPTFEAVLSVPGARVIKADWDGRVIGAWVALEHDRRLYLWAGGTDHTVYKEVSPYAFMLYELLSRGVERGWDVIEFGRGNDEFKRRHGFDGVHLWSLWYAAKPDDLLIYPSRLADLHKGTASAHGYDGLPQWP